MGVQSLSTLATHTTTGNRKGGRCIQVESEGYRRGRRISTVVYARINRGLSLQKLSNNIFIIQRSGINHEQNRVT